STASRLAASSNRAGRRAEWIEPHRQPTPHIPKRPGSPQGTPGLGTGEAYLGGGRPRLLEVERLRFDHRPDEIQERIDWHSAEILARAQSHRHRVRLSFALADDQHVRHLLELCVADLRLHAIAGAVHLDADVSVLEAPCDVFRKVELLVRDRDDLRLYRRQPGREGPGVVLDEATH